MMKSGFTLMILGMCAMDSDGKGIILASAVVIIGCALMVLGSILEKEH